MSSLRPAAESQGNLCFRLLYGCCFRLNSCRAGSEENSGQMLSFGVPRRSEMREVVMTREDSYSYKPITSSSWLISDLPGRRGL